MKDIKAEIEELNERVAQLQKIARKPDRQRTLGPRNEVNGLFSQISHLMKYDVGPLAESVDEYNGNREVLNLMRDAGKKLRVANDAVDNILVTIKKHDENRQDD